MFVQGGLCFFCEQPLPRAEASVEHLLAGANGGSSKDENCVACCKSINALLGCMSLKEKFQVVLNQKGQFKCPNGVRAAIPDSSKAKQEVTGCDSSLADQFELVVENLKNRKSARPTSLKTLASTIRSLKKGISDHEVGAVIEQLKSSGKIPLSGNKVTYTL